MIALADFIKSALSPTKVTSVKLNEEKNRALVIVPEDQLSIAIGKGGQNVRLASKLTDIELDIEADKSTESESAPSKEETVDTPVAEEVKAHPVALV